MTDAPADHARALLDSLGLDPDEDPELAETPEQFTEMLSNLFSGLDEPPPEMSTFAAEYAGDVADHPEPVVLAGLPFYSMCVHHLVPFFGAIDVAYVPDETMTGFGSVGRVVDHFAARPQIQERLVQQIADHLVAELAPEGVLIRCRARQMCMEMRGSEKRGHLVALASRGSLTDGELREEILATFASEQGTP